MASICHVFLVRLTAEATSEAHEKLLEEIAALSELPGVRSFQSGADLSLREGNFDVAIVAEFGSEDDWKEYLVSQPHRQVVSLIDPIRGQTAAIQFKLVSSESIG